MEYFFAAARPRHSVLNWERGRCVECAGHRALADRESETKCVPSEDYLLHAANLSLLLTDPFTPGGMRVNRPMVLENYWPRSGRQAGRLPLR